MCIPHVTSSPKSNGVIKKNKPKKHIKKVAQTEYEQGDPNFVDERIHSDMKKKESIFESLFGDT